MSELSDYMECNICGAKVYVTFNDDGTDSYECPNCGEVSEDDVTWNQEAEDRDDLENSYFADWLEDEK